MRAIVAYFLAAFCVTATAFNIGSHHHLTLSGQGTTSRSSTVQFLATAEEAATEIVAKRIKVKGDVQGGYYRVCVLNEAGKFRRLVGTMSPPDDSDEAEIYVEGKKKLVDGFVKWCQKGNVGLSQVVGVTEILDEEPTGLYDGFYVKTH